MSDESHHERALGGQLLASVSRSFYLTLKALPRELREPISLAYLLARTADTIADTAAVPAPVRLECLRAFAGRVQGRPQAGGALEAAIRDQFVPHQQDAAERRLMERFTDALDWLGTMQGAALQAIRAVLEPIIRGQILDIERFPGDGQLRWLQSDAELHEYTWLVAGCVGEFWTEMCAVEKPGSLAAAADLPAMKAWGARYGQGLQLLNILRDVGEDLRDGRGYLPGGQGGEAALQAEWRRWLGVCREHLESGLQYVRHVADGKLRYATALPLLLGIRTVARLGEASWPEVLQGLKISRLEVARLLAEAAVACRNADALERLYRRLAAA